MTGAGAAAGVGDEVEITVAGAALQPPVQPEVTTVVVPQLLQPVGTEVQLLQAGAGAAQVGAGAAQLLQAGAGAEQQRGAL